ncbi:MAG: hypothetical protein IT428_30905 [Planctomycetaceae bacterium]|nr:hypothetical protein [Planctomycetaceae bacterium]
MPLSPVGSYRNRTAYRTMLGHGARRSVYGIPVFQSRFRYDATLTGVGQVMGTWHYMAPEQMRGEGSADHRADIYALDVVFYELLTGQLPIGRFEPPSKKVQIDVRLDEVVLRALESEPDQRYQKASDVKSAVDAGAVPAVGAASRRDVDAGGLRASEARSGRGSTACCCAECSAGTRS